MHCHQCGFLLPPGAEICPHCSSSTPYNASPTVPPPPPLAPTQFAPGTLPPLAPTQLAPTQFAPEMPPSVDPTQLAPGTPPLAPTQLASGESPAAYQVPPSSSTPNWQAPPPPSTPGWQAESGQSGAGWAYPPDQPAQSGANWQMYPAQSTPVLPPAAQAPMMMPVQPKKSSGCSVAAIIVLVILLVVVCGASLLGGAVWYHQQSAANANATAVADNATASADSATSTALLTPTPYPPYTESNPPSGATFSGTAQQVIASAQLASQVSAKDQPTELQSVFQPDQTIYLAYHWNNVGYTGYVYTIWYLNGQQITSGTSDYIGSAYSYYDGYISSSASQDGQGAIEVYWCKQSDCSERQLAWVRPFSISG